MSAGGSQPQVMYWLKPIIVGDNVGTAPIVSSTGDYESGGTAGAAHGNPYTIVLDQSATSGQTVKLELYASVLGTDSDPTRDGFVTGALDILNHPDSTPLVGKPSPVALLPEFKDNGYSKGKVQGDLSSPADGGPDLGGPLNVSAPPDNTGNWVIPSATAAPVFGTAFNDNGWVDIKLGTFSYTITDTPASGASAELSVERIVNSGYQPIHYFLADSTDVSNEIGSNGSDVLTGPAVTIAIAGEPASDTNTTNRTTQTNQTQTDGSNSIAALLAADTPNPHPTGDRPSDSGRIVALTAFTPAPELPGLGIDPEITQFILGLEAIKSDILSNPAARPSCWGESLATGGGEYRLHFNDNGMLVGQWTIDWGDGSDPQQVPNQPWVIHQYPGGAGQYQITVTARSVNGTFSGGVGGSAGGALSQDFNAGGGMTDSLRAGGHDPDWVQPIGNGGQTTTNFESTPGWDQANAIALDNGNIVVAGTTGDGKFGLVRYYDQPGSPNDGEPDTSFGTSGLVTTAFTAGNASASALAVDGNVNTIVVAGIVLDGSGHNEVALARYNDADGSLDTTFGTGGRVTTDLGSGWTSTAAVVVEGDHSILVAGTMNGHFALLHYASNGTRDTSFGGATSGIVTVDFGGTNETPSAMTLDANGQILVAGTTTQTATGEDFALACFSADGTVATTFGTGGLVTTNFAGGSDEASALSIQPTNGKIVLAGYSNQSGSDLFALARYNTDGSLDTSFGTGGKVTTDFGDGSDRASGVQVQYDGRIVVSGSTLLDGSGNVDTVKHFAAARYNPDGTPDRSFGTGATSPAGTVTTDFITLGFTTDTSSGLLLDTTGRLVVAGTATGDGYSSFAVSCYDPGTSSIGVVASDLPPVLGVIGDQQTTAGQAMNLPEIGRFTHSSVAGDFTYQINWGDGSAPDTGTATIITQGSQTDPLEGSIGGQHTYSVSGVYSVVTTVTDPDGGSDSQTFMVTVNSPPTFLTTSIPDGNVNIGQPYTLPSVTFTDSSLLDSHTAIIDWGDNSADAANVTDPYFDDSLLAPVPGSLTDSHAYSVSGDYTATITLIDAGGATATETFTVHVRAADVALTDFSTDGHLLQVAYSVSNDTSSAPFQIGIYSSPDGITPDQLLGSYPVGNLDSSELTAGLHTISITPPGADVPADYYLIAVADSDATPEDNTRVFDGGIFRANDGTAYVFGTDAADMAQVQTSSLALNNTSYILTSTPTAVHVRTEGGDDAVTVGTGVTEPVWIYGGAGNNSITDGGSGGDVVDGGDGQSTVHGGYGFNLPEIVDDTDPQAAGKTAYYQESGSGWSSATTGFNQTERVIAPASSAQATWTFTSLPSAVYDVYVTWSPQSTAATGAAYVVNDNNTSINPVGQGSIATVDQTIPPADDQAAGVFWHHLGAFQIASGTLKVQLGSDPGYSVLADAVRLVQHTEAPTTNLVLNSFSINTQGQISVQYTIDGASAAPFSIGIYGSPDGSTPATLLQTVEVDDPSLLTGSGAVHTATFEADLSQLTETDYVLAKLDINNEVYQQNRADDTSTPFSGIFQQGDGSVYVVGNATFLVNDQIAITQNGTTGDVTVSVTDAIGNPITSESFSGVSSVTISTPGGGNTITIDPSVTEPVWVLDGSGSSVTGTAANEVALRLDGPPTISEGQSVSLTLQAALAFGTISNFYISWGDGNYSTNWASHEYTTGTGTYTVSATADDTNGISYTCPDTVSVGVLPNAPSGFSATAVSDTGGQIQLSWSNNSQLATGFRLEQSTDGTNYILVATVDSYTSSYLVTGLIASTDYSFRICAVDDAGRSAYVSTTGRTNDIPSGSVASNDDSSSQLVDIGMNLNFYGTRFNAVYVNNNGNLTTGYVEPDGSVTGGSPMGIYSPSDTLDTGYATYGAIFAPFFADVDTRNGHGSVTYTSTTVSGRPAWEADWNGVDYYDVESATDWRNSPHVSKSNTFSVTLVDRSDVAPGDFDIIFKYNGLQWDTGDASGGQNGLAYYSPAYPARAGYSNGSGEAGTYYELSGSGTSGGLLGLSGSHTYEIRNPTVGLTAYRTGGNYGVAVSDADARSGDPSNYVILVDDSTDQAPDGTTTDIDYNSGLITQGSPVNLTDHDFARITLAQLQSPNPPGRTLSGTISLVLSNSASARIFDSSGHELTGSDLTATIGGSGYLAGLANGSVDVYIEGLQADPDFSLTYNYVDSHEITEASASVHMAIADISVVDINGSPMPFLSGTTDDLLGMLDAKGTNSMLDADQSLQATEYKTRIDGLNTGQIQGVRVTSDAGGYYDDTLVDCGSGAESTLFAVLDDENGSPLSAVQQGEILSDLNVHALAIPDPETITITSGKDSQSKVVTVKPTIELVKWFIRTNTSVDPRTKYALGFLTTDSVEIYAGSFYTVNFTAAASSSFWARPSSIGIDSSFNGLTQAVQWFEDGVREWAYKNPADYGEMVRQYALYVKGTGGDAVKVLADTYWFAQWWTKAVSSNPSGSMPGPKQFANATMWAFAGCSLESGQPSAPVNVTRQGTLSKYYYDFDNNIPNPNTDQTHHFAAYFAWGVEMWPGTEKFVEAIARRSKGPKVNPGDFLLAVTAADIGRFYYDNQADPDALRREIMKVLPVSPTKGSLPVENLLWNTAIDQADIDFLTR